VKKKLYEVEIQKIVQKGYGIGFKSKKTFFIPYVIPGERVLVEPVRQKKDVVFGKVKKFLRTNEKRTEPPCPYFGKCGGCHLQMVSYDMQLKLKEEILKDALSHIGNIENIPVEHIEPSTYPFNYRIKAQLPLKRLKGKVYMGFYKPDSHYIVDIEECQIQKKTISEMIKKLKEILQEERITVYDETKKRGRLKHCVIRCDAEEKSVLLIFVTHLRGFPKILAQRIYEIDKEKIKGIVENYNPEEGNRIFGEEIRTLIGDDHLFYRIGKYTFRVSAISFFQLNPETAKKMLDFILSNLSEYKEGIDAFSGVGFFSIPLAERMKKVISIEISKSSYKDLVRNVKINEMMNVESVNADANKYLEEVENANLILLDPPRKGLEKEIFKNIKRISPEKIVYVSCNPQTMAKDIEIFYKDLNYDIEVLKPFDFFPQTHHIEVCSILKKR